MPPNAPRQWWRSVVSLLEELDSDADGELACVTTAPDHPGLIGGALTRLPSPPHTRPPARTASQRLGGRPDGDEPAAALERARRLSRAPRDEFYSPAAYERDLLERDERERSIRRSAPTGLRRAPAAVAVAPAASARAAARGGLEPGALSELASYRPGLTGGRADRPAARAAVLVTRTERAISAPPSARQAAAAAPQPRRRRALMVDERARSASPPRSYNAPAAAPAALSQSPVMTVERLPPPLPQSGAGPGRPPVASTAEQLEATKLYLRRAITSTHELSATNDRLRAQLAERDKQLSSHEARKKLTARQGIDQQQMLQTLNAKLEAKDAQLRELQAKLCQMERAARPRSESERLKTNNHILNLQRQLVRLKGQLSEEFPTREHPFESALNDADRLRTEHERRWRTERVRALDLTRALEEARARIAQLEREHDAAPVATARGREPRPVEPAHGLKLAPAWHDSKLHAPISSPRGEDVGYWIGGIAVPAQPAGRHSPGRSTIQT